MSEPKFTSSRGNFVTKSLFVETCNEPGYTIYTLKNRDHEGYQSLYRLYMDEADITEWRFANKYLGGWDHWELLCSLGWFKPYISKWRKELELKIRSKSLAEVQDIAAQDGHKQRLEANKYLLSGNWMTKEESKGRGRPSKDEIKEEATRMATEEKKLQEDLQRVLN